CIRRPAHSRTVVTTTAPQEGSAVGRLAGGPAACRGAGTAPGPAAGMAPGRVAGAAPGRGAGTAPGIVLPGAGLGGGPRRAGTRGGRPADPGAGPALSGPVSDGLVSGGLVSAGLATGGLPSAGPASAWFESARPA